MKTYLELNAEGLSPAEQERLKNTYKECRDCGEEKPELEFYPWNKEDRGGQRSPRCIVCDHVRSALIGSKKKKSKTVKSVLERYKVGTTFIMRDNTVVNIISFDYIGADMWATLKYTDGHQILKKVHELETM